MALLQTSLPSATVVLTGTNLPTSTQIMQTAAHSTVCAGSGVGTLYQTLRARKQQQAVIHLGPPDRRGWHSHEQFVGATCEDSARTMLGRAI